MEKALIFDGYKNRKLVIRRKPPKGSKTEYLGDLWSEENPRRHFSMWRNDTFGTFLSFAK